MRQRMSKLLIDTRKAKGLTRDQLQKRSGVDIMVIDAIENCNVIPTVDVIHRLARALNVKPMDLLPDEIPEYRSNDIPF
jgi:transcriptional regulator with XRE-family HTH domain